MKIASTLSRLAALALFAFSVAYAQRAPTIQLFAAQPPEIAPGGTSMLVWSVSGATSLSLEPVIGVVTSPFLMVQPTATTTYTLTATNDAGTVQASVTVTVTEGGGERGGGG